MGEKDIIRPMNIPQFLFIYAKEGKVRCLTADEAHRETLTGEGWAHTATINPARWIEAMANGDQDPSDMLDEIQFSKP